LLPLPSCRCVDSIWTPLLLFCACELVINGQAMRGFVISGEMR
jgi:hypothetical protein